MIRREVFNTDIYPRLVAEYIYEVAPNKFSFIDETGAFYEWEYPTLEEAKIALKQYVEYL